MKNLVGIRELIGFVICIMFAVRPAVACPPDTPCGVLSDEAKARKAYLLREAFSRQENLNAKGSKTLSSPLVSFPPPPKGIANNPASSMSGSREKKESMRTGAVSTPVVTSGATGKPLPPVEVHPDRTVWITLSNTDVNRVVCQAGDISDVFYSQEKGILVKVSGGDAFIKFRVRVDQETGRVDRVTVPSEFYVRCAGETYSFIARPRPVPARTVYLVSEAKRRKPPEEITKKNTLDEALVSIVRDVFLDRIPPSWERVEKFDAVILNRLLKADAGTVYDVRIVEKARYRIPGLPLLVRIFRVELPAGVVPYATINEKVLLDPRVTKNPVAISLLDHWIRAKSHTRAVIVERVFP